MLEHGVERRNGGGLCPSERLGCLGDAPEGIVGIGEEKLVLRQSVAELIIGRKS